MDLKIFQKGFNFSQDGPGNRLVYHLQGCNMKCPWCSNPEGMSNSSASFFCYSAEQLLQEAISSKPMFFEGGGVTFTGGECTLQFNDLKKALTLLKENDINTAIETNGTHKDLAELFPIINHLIIDLKHPNDDIHIKHTGISNKITKQNILLAAKSNKNILIRIPLINEFNTDDTAIAEYIEFFSKLNTENVCIELLKYHEYGKDKWLKLGLEYTPKNAFINEAKRIDIEQKFKNAGLKTLRT